MEELKEGWRKVKLGEICNISSSKRIFMSEYVKNGIPFYRGKEIIEKSLGKDTSTKLYISESKYNDIAKKYSVPLKKDILLTSVGTIGVPYLVRDEKFYFKDGNLTWLNDFKKNIDSYFIYYWLKSKKGQEQIQAITIGSTQKALTIENLKKLELLLPDIKIQKKIISILSSLDEKIELNRKINQNLEETAQTLFKRWFVDFEFPNEEEKPYKSSGGKMIESELGEIPEGWRVGKLGEIVKIKNGYSYKGKELMQSENAMLTIKNFNRDGSFKIDGYKEISLGEKVKESHYVEIGDILVAHTDLTQGAEIIGNPIMVFSKANYKKIIMSMDLVKVEAKYKNFIYFLLKDKRFKNHALGYINGTTVLHLNKNCISEYKFVLPIENKLIEKLEKYLQKINLQICINQKETEKLIELRDYLLPRLMSGEISV